MAIVAGAAVFPMSAQSVISAHSGTIHFTEGQVTLDGNAVQSKFGEFPEVKPGQVLATQDGRAEILLTPGVFLRLSENSSFKMVSNQLTNTRLEVQSGAAMVEVGELLKDNSITIAYHDADVSLAQKGLYRFDSDPNRLMVYDGEANVVTPSSDPTQVRKGHELIFGEKLEAKTFDTKATDEFYRWSARRDEYIAEANISAAKTARDAGYSATGAGFSGAGTGVGYNGYGYSGFGMMPGMGSWAWNPWFGMFTYVPLDGMFYSPFGFGYYSPYLVGGLYGPYSPFLYGGGSGTGRGIFGTNGGIGGSRPASPTTSASISRASAFNAARSSGGAASSASGGFGSGGGIGSAARSGGSASSGGGSGAGMSSSGGMGGGHAGGASGGGHR